MSLFSRITKSSDKSPYPWSQRKLSGGTSSNAVPRFGHAAAALQTEQLIIYGGYHKSPNKKDLFIVDTGNISVNALNASGDVPPPRSFATLVSVGHHVLLYGGEPTMPDEKWDPHAYSLNISTRQWSRIRVDGHLPVERSRHSAVVADGVMYVWGGQRAGRYLNDLIAFDMNEYPSKSQWEFIVPTTEGPSARAGHAAVIFENKMYIFGGTDGDHLYNDVWAFDLHTRAWAQVPAVGFIPIPRTDFAAAAVNGVMYVFGGRGPDGQDLGDLCAFKIRSQRWYMFQNMGPTPSPRYGLSLTAVREKMFVIGGDASGAKLDDASFAYVLDSAKIRYPPEVPVQAPPPQPSTSQEIEYPSQRGHMPSNIQNSQSTPVRSAPYPQKPQHQQLQQHQQQQQQQHQEQVAASRDMEAGPPQPLNEPQSSVSTPLPGNANRNPPSSQRSNGPEVSSQTTGKPRHASVIPEAARRRTRTTSPMPLSEIDTTSANQKYSDPISPSSINSTDHELPTVPQRSNIQHSDERQQQQQQQQQPPPRLSQPRNTIAGVTPPPRPSREGVDLGSSARYNIINKDQNIDDRPKAHVPRHVEAAPVRSASPHTMPNGRIHDAAANGLPLERSLSPTHRQQIHQPVMNSTSPQPSALRPKSLMTSSADSPMQDEKANLIRELKAREMIIAEMKKKEQWWRMEVSIARKMRAAKGETFDDQAQAEEAMLIEFSDASPDKLKLFEQLIAVKSELRRVKQSIIHQAQPMSQKVEQADRMRIAALQEAGYFKSKYHALKSQQTEELARIETERAADLEKRLAQAMAENDSLGRQLEQLQQRAQHDHASRVAAEERAKEAHERAQEAQEAHQRALDELAKMHARASKAENQAREGALQIAELTHQLAQALSSETSSHELSEAHLSISRLEAANLKARNEAASLRQRLAECMDDIARLRTLLSEREEALKEATRQLEDSDIQLGMMRDALSRKGIAINGISASSETSATTTVIGGF